MRRRKGPCDNLIYALKLLANQQKDGDSPKSIIAGLHERSRRGIMDGLRSFIEADNHSAVGIFSVCFWHWESMDSEK